MKLDQQSRLRWLEDEYTRLGRYPSIPEYEAHTERTKATYYKDLRTVRADKRIADVAAITTIAVQCMSTMLERYERATQAMMNVLEAGIQDGSLTIRDASTVIHGLSNVWDRTISETREDGDRETRIKHFEDGIRTGESL